MAIWVCRTGKKGQYEDEFLNNNQIYLTRAGLDFNLSICKKKEILAVLQNKENAIARQTMSNIWSQIDIFANRMDVGDIVIIPKKASQLIHVCVITSEYIYEPNETFPRKHSRGIRFLKKNINTNPFPQDIRYSLGTFRTIFSLSQEDRLIEELRKNEVIFNEISF